MENPDIIYGKNPVESLLENKPERINKVFIIKGVKFDTKIKNIYSLAKNFKINIQEIPREKMDKLVNGVHQGVAASVSPVEYADFDQLVDSLKNKTRALLIVLDRVEDPHNLGSIIRTAAAAGVDGIIIPGRHSSPITPTVEKASVGTVEMVKISRVTNLTNAIEKLKENNFWIIGAEADAEKYYFEQDYNMNCALVIGGEDRGISQLVKKNCDFIVKIPMINTVNSLNVANASSILIYELVRQRILNKE